MPDSTPQGKPEHDKQIPSADSPATLSSGLPSSSGNSPKRVTPKDITPEHASWKDLQVKDRGSDLPCEESRQPQQEQAAAAAQRQPVDAAAASSADLPSSRGDSPQEVTPKDIAPGDASWNDLHIREIAAGEPAQREESMLDEAIELTFPASDPTAELPASSGSEKDARCNDEEESMLDEAIDLTFPASDPIAVSSITRIEVNVVRREVMQKQ
ncbi:MAG TPA: hypothetical protein VJ577_03410 [Burkholderiaceae bacterium]|nr:hypothetical protein [Burkholderiaceae bacterium]